MSKVDLGVIDLTNDDSEPEAQRSPARAVKSVYSAEVRRTLRTAIDQCAEDRSREILTEVVETIPAAERVAVRWLLAKRRRPDDGDSENGGVGEDDDCDFESGEEDLVQRWETCDHCGEEFDAGEERSESECVYHESKLQARSPVAGSWDEDSLGPLFSAENLRDNPGYFYWECCDHEPDNAGCQEGKHEATENLCGTKRKRSRLG